MDWLKKSWHWILAGVALAALAYLLEFYGVRDAFSTWFETDLRPWLDDRPVLAPFVFIGVYIISVVGFMPGSVMTIAGGALFGWLWGTIYVVIAATTASGIAFLIARYVAADWVEQRAGDTLLKVKKGIEEDGWRFVAFTRLVPVFPYTLLNYAFGLTRINFWVYFLVTGITMIPGTFAYVYAGFAGREVAAGDTTVGQVMIYVGIAIGLLILISMVPRWVRRFKDGSLEPDPEES